MKAKNILWDVDVEDNADEVMHSLPDEIEIPEGVTDEEEEGIFYTNYAIRQYRNHN